MVKRTKPTPIMKGIGEGGRMEEVVKKVKAIEQRAKEYRVFNRTLDKNDRHSYLKVKGAWNDPDPLVRDSVDRSSRGVGKILEDLSKAGFRINGYKDGKEDRSNNSQWLIRGDAQVAFKNTNKIPLEEYERDGGTFAPFKNIGTFFTKDSKYVTGGLYMAGKVALAAALAATFMMGAGAVTGAIAAETIGMGAAEAAGAMASGAGAGAAAATPLASATTATAVIVSAAGQSLAQALEGEEGIEKATNLTTQQILTDLAKIVIGEVVGAAGGAIASGLAARVSAKLTGLHPGLSNLSGKIMPVLEEVEEEIAKVESKGGGMGAYASLSTVDDDIKALDDVTSWEQLFTSEATQSFDAAAFEQASPGLAGRLMQAAERGEGFAELKAELAAIDIKGSAKKAINSIINTVERIAKDPSQVSRASLKQGLNDYLTKKGFSATVAEGLTALTEKAVDKTMAHVKGKVQGGTANEEDGGADESRLNVIDGNLIEEGVTVPEMFSIKQDLEYRNFDELLSIGTEMCQRVESDDADFEMQQYILTRDVFQKRMKHPVLFSQQDGTLSIAFAGVDEPAQDALNEADGTLMRHYSNLKAMVSNPYNEMRFHAACLRALNTSYPRIRAELDKYSKEYDSFMIFGSSTGGAMATVFYYLYMLDDVRKESKMEIKEVVTFGSPRVVVNTYAAEREYNNICPNLLRVFNTLDVETYRPLKLKVIDDVMDVPNDFVHVGKPFCVDSNYETQNANLLIVQQLKPSQHLIAQLLKKFDMDEQFGLMSGVLENSNWQSLLAQSCIHMLGRAAPRDDIPIAAFGEMCAGWMEDMDSTPSLGSKVGLLEGLTLNNLAKSSYLRGLDSKTQSFALASLALVAMAATRRQTNTGSIDSYKAHIEALILREVKEKKPITDKIEIVPAGPANMRPWEGGIGYASVLPIRV